MNFMSSQRRSRLLPISIIAGLCGLGGWIAFLGCAFVSYPSLDNLAVGWPVFVFQGDDALGAIQHNPAQFAVALLIESLVVFLVFAVGGAAIVYYRGRKV